MTLPNELDMELPLLVEIQKAGGEVKLGDGILRAVQQHFPGITREDLTKYLEKSKRNKWKNEVMWVRKHLVLKGEIDRSSPRGIWRITERGIARLRREGWLDEAPEGAKPPPSTKRAIAPPQPLELAPITPTVGTHKQLQEMLVDLGLILGKYAIQDFKVDIFTYDVVWKTQFNLDAATHVFQVQQEDNLGDALFGLRHAYDMWGTKLFFIVTNEREREKTQQRATSLFAELFPKASEALVVLTAEEVYELHTTLSKHENTIRRMV